MKAKKLSLVFVGLCCLTMLASCGATRSAEEVEVASQPCSNCFSTETLIRARGVGESRDQQMALEKARNNALAEMASKIRVTVENMMESFSKSRTIDGEEEMVGLDVNMTKRLVNETIQGYRTICEKYTVRTDKNGTKIYKCYYAIELGKEDASSSLYKGLSSSTSKLDVDYEKFRMRFEQEMATLDKKNQ